ncbi:TetR/AcrR family transcriptional regulator [Amphibacillus sp. Q70]|uniref:TetR/AcrR family transcriptional regulator n=1 Tax=Amphibacillus sp. Q70 TaxID=3453416 RepID=UPI003F875038
MPKQTFFNLPEQKREKLIDALKREFSRVSVHEASIANIVKSAQIPRGSFYQYFDDKEEAFLFLMTLYGKENKKRFAEYLEQTNGNLFASFSLMFELMIDELVNGNQYHFFRNAFLNMNHKIEQAFTSNVKTDDFKTELDYYAKWVINDQLAVQSKQELEHAFKILLAVTFRNIIDAFVKQLTVEEATQNYQIEIDMLKNGLLKSDSSS